MYTAKKKNISGSNSDNDFSYFGETSLHLIIWVELIELVRDFDLSNSMLVSWRQQWNLLEENFRIPP